MAATVTCFNALISPYTYLGQPRLLEIARECGAEVDYRPFNIKTVFDHVGTKVPGERHPFLQAYRKIELQRWANHRGLPIHLQPRHWPVPSHAAAGMVIAAQREGRDVGELVRAILAAVWAEERDITDRDTLVEIGTRAGFDGAALYDAGHSAEAQQGYEDNTREAIERGVFGAPTFFVGGEMFWGQDRLEFVAAALRAAA